MKIQNKNEILGGVILFLAATVLFCVSLEFKSNDTQARLQKSKQFISITNK